MAQLDHDEPPAAPAPVVGTCRYVEDSGWTFDSNLLRLWGADDAGAAGVLLDPVLPVGGPSVPVTWDSWLGGLGDQPFGTLTYRIVHADTGQSRELQAVVRREDPQSGGHRIQTWHMDVTDTVAVARLQERTRGRATNDRMLVLGQVGAAMAASTRPDDLLHRIARLVAASLGGSAHLIVLRSDGDCQHDIVAPETTDTDPGDHDRRTTGSPAGDRGIPPDDLTALPRTCGRHDPRERTTVARVLGQTEQSTAHHLAAPIRISGRTVGTLAVTRREGAGCFDPADPGLLQVLADGAGAAVAQSRTRELLDSRAERLHRLAGEREDLKEQRDDLLEQLDAAENRERALVAEVVHDDPLQLIVAAGLRLDLLPAHPDRAASAEIQRAVILLEQAGERLRALMTVGLTPPDLTAGLWPAIRDIAQVLFVGSGVPVTVEAPPDPLTPPATATGYRILREAIMNARKHSQARALVITGERSGDTLLAVVRDDGIGCERNASPDGHFGISTMRARAEAAGGQVTIGSPRGCGCEVSLELPDAFLS